MNNNIPIVFFYYRRTNNTPNPNWREEPQSNAMYAATCIFISGGMNLALGLGWNLATYIPTTLHFQFCWFIGVIAGVIISLPLITNLAKKYYMMIGALMILVSGIIFTSVPYEYNAIIAARYINGFGVGFVTVPFLIHASEIALNDYRVACSVREQFGYAIGITLQLIYSSLWTYSTDFAANRLHGIFSIICGVLAGVCTFAVIESPIFHIRKGEDDAALKLIGIRALPAGITEERKAQFEKLKEYVRSEENLTIIESVQRSLVPLVKMLIYRSLVAFTFTLPQNYILALLGWQVVLFGILRMLGTLFSMPLLTLSLKSSSAISLLIVAAFTIAFGAIYANTPFIFDVDLSTIDALLLVPPFFSGLFVGSTSAYLGEAFSLHAKPYCIALCVIVEQVIHIVVICTFVINTHNEFVFNIVIGCILAVCSIAAFFILPATVNRSLSDAQASFRNIIFTKFS